DFPAVGAFDETEAGDDAFFGGAKGFVVAGDPVAHAVDDPFAVDLLHGLDDVGVAADDQVDGGVGEELFGDTNLVGGGFGLVLDAPVQAGYHDIGAGRLGGAGGRQYLCGVEFVGDPRGAGRDA